jgi:hypothetical protein
LFEFQDRIILNDENVSSLTIDFSFFDAGKPHGHIKASEFSSWRVGKAWS